jgi:hypothetical protein
MQQPDEANLNSFAIAGVIVISKRLPWRRRLCLCLAWLFLDL